jgi:filamentous hemagglutinin family protein
MPICIADGQTVPFRSVSPQKLTRQRLKRSTMLAAALAFMPVLAQAQALPTGGQVVAGQAGISGSGSALTISQTSDKAVIDWSGFSIGQGGVVQFNNGGGATLNRVTGGSLSSIDGLLSATGSVYLINPNGVIIGKSGVVKVGGGFVASTLDIGNANFLNGGDLNFEGPSLASVVNLGQIGALGGDVALVAANVRNDGAISAPNGALGLLAGNRILMRDTTVDDGKFLVLSGGAGTSATNTGSVEAATAELRAQGGNVYALAGNTQGLIRATGVSNHDGHIFLSAGSGSVEVSGSTLSATTNGEGGKIAVTGQKISVTSDATLDASGANTGGSVTAIADMASGKLDFHGTALSKGSLNGGFIETSGHRVDFSGARINTSGATSGNWLVDPDDLTVDATAAGTIQTNLATTNVTLQTTSTTASGPGNSASGSGDIIVNSDIAWSTSNTLTLDSYHSIQVNANITASGSGGVVLTTNNGGAGGDYTFALGKSLSFTGSGGSLTINGNSYTLLNNLTDLIGIDNTSGRYALASSIDGGSASYSLIITDFSGTFTGLGHTISKLSLRADVTGYGGIFSDNHGTLRDIGVVGGTFYGFQAAGALVGRNSGTVQNAFATSTIDSNFEGGGLVGENHGSITNSFATGSVHAGDASGGLVGDNEGSITNSFATGNASGSTVGGLAGVNYHGSIATSYSTGYVTATSGQIGGLTGLNNSGTIDNSSSYFDSTTSGRADSNGTAKTTAQLQGSLPSGLSSSVWGTGTDLYPYLKSFFPTGPQVVSGTAYTNAGVGAAIAAVRLYTGGNVLGQTKSGANGYYYLMFAPGTIGGSTKIGITETLNGDSAASAAIYNDAPSFSGGVLGGVGLISTVFQYNTAATTFSALKTDAATTFGSTLYTTLLSGPGAGTDKIYASGGFTLDAALGNSGTVVIQSGGDLSINSDITVSGANQLTLDAHDNLYINANLLATGPNAVSLTAANGGSGDYSFLTGKSLTFTNASGGGQTLTINGQAYDLLYTRNDFENIEFGTGFYALAKGLDFTGASYSASVIAQLDGTFTGMGNTISGMTINGTGVDYVGLIGTLSNAGTVRDVGINGGAIYGNFYSGPLVGHNEGTILNAWSSADAHVAFRSGGLVGHNEGTISRSHATGAVTSQGDNGSGVSDMGGLVGWNDASGLISQSYATGTVTGISNTTGGLVAFNSGGTITDSFATGGVFGNLYAGGLVGFGDGTVSNSYSTGYVHAVTSGGGFAGHFTGTVTNTYWDTTTSGTNVGIADGVSTGTPTGLTRTTLQNGSLPTGFSSSIWATGSGLYPYFKALFPTGMQSISGFTYASNGSALPAATVAVFVGGTQVGNTTAASGADGYYYLMANPGTVTGTTKIGITETVHNAGSVSATAYTDTPTLTSGQVTGFNVTSGRLTYNTSEATYGALKTSAEATFGTSLHNTLTTALDAAALKIVASSAFAVDQAISRSGTALIQSGGDMTVTSGGSVSSTSSGTAITLAADGSFINNAGSSSVSASNGRWLIYTQAHGNSAGAATANSFGGLTGKNFYNDAFNFGTGSLATTPNSGNRFVTGYAPVLTATPDTKTVIYNGAIQSDSYSLSGYLTGDQSADNLTGSVTGLTASSRNAGGYNLTASGSLVSDLNYTISYGSGTLTVAKAALTIAAGSDSKTYDTTATSTGTVGVTGLQGSDTVTGKSQAFDSKNAGSRTLSITGYTVNDGNGGNNYTVTTQTAAGTIAKAALTLTASSDSKTYDATTASSGTVSVTGLLGADTVTGKSQAFDSKNAGSRTLVVSGYTVNDGNNGGNYAVTTQTASGTIAKAALTAGLTGSTTKIYDASLSATLAAGNYTLSGIKGSDTVTLSNPALGSYGDANVGTGKTVTVTGLTLLGTDAGNYTVNSSASATIGSITARKLTLTADNQAKMAGAADPLLTYTFTTGSLAGSDSLSGALARASGEDPGVYDINQGSLAASSNYDVTFVKGLFAVTAVAKQNDPVVNPVNSSVNTASQPTIRPAPIGLDGPSDADGAGSDASGTGDAGSAPGEGDEKATGPSVTTAGQSGSTCESGEDCANTPYPDNQSVSPSISFSSK